MLDACGRLGNGWHESVLDGNLSVFCFFVFCNAVLSLSQK